jgi:hypothetical protein
VAAARKASAVKTSAAPVESTHTPTVESSATSVTTAALRPSWASQNAKHQNQNDYSKDSKQGGFPHGLYLGSRYG